MIPQTLIDGVRNRTVVPFVGAGLSASVGREVFPSWSGLINRFADRLDHEGLQPSAAEVRAHLAAKRFPEAAELAFEKLTPDRFLREMEAVFRVAIPREANLSAVEALWRLRPRAVITTNYDNVLQWPFMFRGSRPYSVARVPPRLIYNSDQRLLRNLTTPPAGDDDEPSIWHLHGSADHSDTIILTDRQYQRLYGATSEQYGLYSFALDQLRALVASRALLFVGFSMDDPFIRAQLEYIFAQTSKQNPVSFVLLKKGEKDATALLNQHHVQVIEFDDFGPPMVRVIGEIADEAWGQGGASVTVPGALVGLVDDLKRLLRKVTPTPAIAGRAFNRWRPQAWDPFPLGGGVDLALAAADKLANAMRQGGGHYPLLEFVRELGSEPPGSRKKILDPWLAAAAASLASDPADAARLLAGGFTPPNDEDFDDPYLLVRLEESAGDAWRGQAWLFGNSGEPSKLFPDEQEWARGAFPALLSDLLGRMDALNLSLDETTVAFMVPRGLIVEAIDLLQPTEEILPQPPIGRLLPVTVRSLERLKYARIMRRLRTSWEALKSVQSIAWTLDNAVPPETLNGAVWLEPTDAGPVLAERLQKHGVMCAVLAAPPSSQPADAAADLFNCVIQAGVPAVIWLRNPAAADLTAARAAMKNLLDGTTPPLPQRVWQLRQAAHADANPAHPGQCLVLLWDDADRMPPDYDPDQRAVVLRG